MSEPERAHFCEPCGTSHGMPRCEVRRPVSDPSETLALIVDHRLRVHPNGDGWAEIGACAAGLAVRVAPSIGEAVRECASRIKEEK